MSVPPPSAFGIGKDPQVEAANVQAEQAQRYNALLRQQFGESRGSTGHAFLSEDLGRTEHEFGVGASDLARSLRDYYGTPSQIAQRGAAVADRYRPLLEQGATAAAGIFSGAEESKRLAAADPVFRARIALADTSRAGIMKGIMDRLNAIRTANAAKGYLGSGSASENLALRASIEGNQAAAGTSAAAALQNEQERQAIRNRVLDLQLQSPELAGALAAQAIKFETLPAETAAAIQRGILSPLDYFRLGVGNPPTPVLPPWALPVPGAADYFSNSLSANGAAAGRYFANRDLANRYGANQAQADFNYQYGGGGSPAGYPGYTPYDQYPDSIDYGGWGAGAGGGAAAGAVGGAAASAF